MKLMKNVDNNRQPLFAKIDTKVYNVAKNKGEKAFMEELIDIHLNGQLYLSDRIQNQDYDIYYSKVIDDQYWNFAYLKNNEIDIKAIYDKVKTDMEKLKSIYNIR